jgi:hypothetical protein
VNSSRSAFACYSFKQSFFTFFEAELSSKSRLNDQTLLNNTTVRGDETLNTADESLIEETEPFKCKIPAKVCKKYE